MSDVRLLLRSNHQKNFPSGVSSRSREAKSVRANARPNSTGSSAIYENWLAERWGVRPSGTSGNAESRAHAVIAFVACDGVGVTATAIAEILGVGDGAITTARRRGETLIASVGATVDIVLRWPAASAR